MDLTLEELVIALKDELDTLPTYAYVIRSVKERIGEDGGFVYVQRGSGPNWQGGFVTLCTCKHRMRTFLDCESWKGVWIAGCTGRRTGAPRNNLVYLMRVGHAFPSHRDLWYSRDIPAVTKKAKAADRHRCGDLFRPKGSNVEPHKWASYEPPVDGHSHKQDQEWHKDIWCPKAKRRQPALLAGDPQFTFVWRAPLVYNSQPLFIGQKKWPTLRGFVRALRDLADEGGIAQSRH